jgi:murein DD-endopeptidase MepM/ murein hydrolase activator NlpD
MLWTLENMRTISIATLLITAALTACAGPRVEWGFFEPYPHGGYHPGIDISGNVGTPVRAPHAGRVIWAEPNGVVAAKITLEHEWQGRYYTTYYYHISDPLVRTGDRVVQGQLLAELALTGERGRNDPRTIGRPHLHFEATRDGRRDDPQKLLPLQCPTKEKPKVDWQWPVGC